VLGELNELGVGATDISELRCAESGEVGLRSLARVMTLGMGSHMYVKSDNGVLSA